MLYQLSGVHWRRTTAAGCQRWARGSCEVIVRETPLWWATENVHERAAKLLFERKEVNPNIRNEYDQTILLLAAKRWYERLVRLLLGRKGVSPDQLDRDGRTSLS